MIIYFILFVLTKMNNNISTTPIKSNYLVLTELIQQNPHFKRFKCENPGCSSEVHGVGINYINYLYMILSVDTDKVNYTNAIDGCWDKCDECNKEVLFCTKSCQKFMKDTCYKCNKCSKCSNRAILRCSDNCMLNYCKHHSKLCNHADFNYL